MLFEFYFLFPLNYEIKKIRMYILFCVCASWMSVLQYLNFIMTWKMGTHNAHVLFPGFSKSNITTFRLSVDCEYLCHELSLVPSI